MEQLIVVLGLAGAVKAIVDLLISPVKQQYPTMNLWWFVYVGVLAGLVVGWFSGVNVFSDWIADPITGRVLTGILIGGGSKLINDVFKPNTGAAAKGEHAHE